MRDPTKQETYSRGRRRRQPVVFVLTCLLLATEGSCMQTKSAMSIPPQEPRQRRSMLLEVSDTCTNVMRNVCEFNNSEAFESAMDSYFTGAAKPPSATRSPTISGKNNTANSIVSDASDALIVSSPTCDSIRTWLDSLEGFQCVYRHDVCHEMFDDFDQERMGKADSFSCPFACRPECEVAKNEWNKLLIDDIPRPRENCDSDMYKVCGVSSFDMFSQQTSRLANDIINRGFQCQSADAFANIAPSISCVLSLPSCESHWVNIRDRLITAVTRLSFDAETTSTSASPCDANPMQQCGATCRFSLSLMQDVAAGGTGLAVQDGNRSCDCGVWSTPNVVLFVVLIVLIALAILAMIVHWCTNGCDNDHENWHSCCGRSHDDSDSEYNGRGAENLGPEANDDDTFTKAYSRHSTRSSNMCNRQTPRRPVSRRLSAGSILRQFAANNLRHHSARQQQGDAEAPQLDEAQKDEQLQDTKHVRQQAWVAAGEEPERDERAPYRVHSGRPPVIDMRVIRSRMIRDTLASGSLSVVSGHSGTGRPGSFQSTMSTASSPLSSSSRRNMHDAPHLQLQHQQKQQHRLYMQRARASGQQQQQQHPQPIIEVTNSAVQLLQGSRSDEAQLSPDSFPRINNTNSGESRESEGPTNTRTATDKQEGKGKQRYNSCASAFSAPQYPAAFHDATIRRSGSRTSETFDGNHTGSVSGLTIDGNESEYTASEDETVAAAPDVRRVSMTLQKNKRYGVRYTNIVHQSRVNEVNSMTDSSSSNTNSSVHDFRDDELFSRGSFRNSRNGSHSYSSGSRENLSIGRPYSFGGASAGNVSIGSGGNVPREVGHFEVAVRAVVVGTEDVAVVGPLSDSGHDVPVGSKPIHAKTKGISSLLVSSLGSSRV